MMPGDRTAPGMTQPTMRRCRKRRGPMADIRFDMTAVTPSFFTIAGQTPAALDGSTSPGVSLVSGRPATQTGSASGFGFEVTADGLID